MSPATGAVWSTDAPYRETHEEAALFGGEGVKAVDMESAGLFAAAHCLLQRGRVAQVVGPHHARHQFDQLTSNDFASRH